MSPVQKEDLQTYFEKSAAAVLQASDYAETEYIRPGFDALLRSFQKKPIRSTFLSIFSILSFLPTIAFIGFSLFVLGSCMFFALAGALIISAAIITTLGSMLAITLTILFFISLPLTATILSSLLAFRLLLLIRNNGTRDGLAAWVQETKSRIYALDQSNVDSVGVSGVKEEEKEAPSVRTEEKDQGGENEQNLNDDASSSDGSIGSTIVVALSPDMKQKTHGDPDGNDINFEGTVSIVT